MKKILHIVIDFLLGTGAMSLIAAVIAGLGYLTYLVGRLSLPPNEDPGTYFIMGLFITVVAGVCVLAAINLGRGLRKEWR